MSEGYTRVGECEWCDRPIYKSNGQRGRNPRFCFTCKENPDVQREVAKNRQQDRKKTADDRVEQLMKRLESVEKRVEKLEPQAPGDEGPTSISPKQPAAAIRRVGYDE